MKYIGFSTGALALGDFRSALSMLQGKGTRAVELSALRDHEVEPLMAALPALDLTGFAYVSVHLPSKFRRLTERQVVGLLNPCIERKIPVVLHPDVIENVQIWRSFGALLCIENMDKRKSTGRTVQELEHFFSEFPDATFCLDVAHARQVDSTMGEAWFMLNRFARRLRQIHISEIDGTGHHHGLSLTAISATAGIARLVRADIPVIIEAQVDEADIDHEIESVKRAFQPTGVSEAATADWGALA
jgi:hypothetical protein